MVTDYVFGSTHYANVLISAQCARDYTFGKYHESLVVKWYAFYRVEVFVQKHPYLCNFTSYFCAPNFIHY